MGAVGVWHLVKDRKDPVGAMSGAPLHEFIEVAIGEELFRYCLPLKKVCRASNG